jgi:hypothetical protein
MWSGWSFVQGFSAGSVGAGWSRRKRSHGVSSETSVEREVVLHERVLVVAAIVVALAVVLGDERLRAVGIHADQFFARHHR